MHFQLRRALVIAIPALLLILTPAASSAAKTPTNTTTISIKSASLAPGGANVTITYSCFPNGNGAYFYNSFGDAQVQEVTGASGSSFFHPRCNDRNQTQTVFVPGPFTSGAAAIRAFVCGFDCNSATKEVRLK